jgi:hypothetical protein
MWPNPLRAVRNSKNPTFQCTVVALATALITFVPAAGLDRQSVTRLDVTLLPEGPDGAASIATSAIDTGIDYTHPDLYVAGALLIGSDGGIWTAALWHQDGAGFGDPMLLPDGGYGGRVNALAIVGDFNGDGVRDLACAGAVRDEAGSDQPALWIVDVEAAVRVPLGDGDDVLRFGEAVRVATGDFNRDSIPDIVTAGWATDDDGVKRAFVHITWGDGQTTLDFLPPLEPGLDAAAMGAATLEGDPDQPIIIGSVYNAVGEPQAALWRHETGEWSDPERLGNLQGGDASSAWTFTDLGPGTFVIGGYAENAGGNALPAMWTGSDGDWTVRRLPLPSGFQQGRVNSIIAVLIGIVAAGEMNGAGGPSAALWVVPRNGRPRVFDLNRFHSNLPDDQYALESVEALTGNSGSDWFLGLSLAGVATDMDGTPHAYIGELHSAEHD